MAARKKRAKEAVPAASRGLDARRLASTQPPASVETLARAIEGDGGSALAIYRDPLGSSWQILAALPLDAVEPTPYQRDLSETHVARLAKAIDKLDRYLDPVIAVPAGEGKYWSPNGYHRLGAMRQLGAKSIVALVIPEPEVAHRILLLNTEKAHNLREKALEVARLAEALAVLDDRPEREFETEFEEAAFVTLGLCYQQNGRFSGGAYHPILKRCDKFLASKLPNAIRLKRSMLRPVTADASIRVAKCGDNDPVRSTLAPRRWKLSRADVSSCCAGTPHSCQPRRTLWLAHTDVCQPAYCTSRPARTVCAFWLAGTTNAGSVSSPRAYLL